MIDQLPSREEAAFDQAPSDSEMWLDHFFDVWKPIIEKYAAGGLVDREAINYEAAIDVWERYERADEIDDQYRTPADFVREAVAAAIGVRDTG